MESVSAVAAAAAVITTLIMNSFFPLKFNKHSKGVHYKALMPHTIRYCDASQIQQTLINQTAVFMHELNTLGAH